MVGCRFGAKNTLDKNYLYFAEKVRKARYDLDQTELKPYFQLDQMVAAAFCPSSNLLLGSGLAASGARRSMQDMKVYWWNNRFSSVTAASIRFRRKRDVYG